MSWDGWRRVRRVGRRGKGDLEGDDDVACNPHAMSSIYFLCAVWWHSVQPTHCVILFLFLCAVWRCSVQPTCCVVFLFLSVVWRGGMQPTHRVVYFFSSVLFDAAPCNPHATSSISFPQCCLMTQHATHMLHHLFLPSMLLDDTVCNPHAASCISSFNVAWWRGIQPTCRVVYFFPSILFISFFPCCLMMRHATHMPCCLFIFIFIPIYS